MRDEDIVNVVMMWMAFFGVIFGACMIGLTLAILKPILLFFGIDWNL
jgi:hypothetical protein